jgi:hypothetical protein
MFANLKGITLISKLTLTVCGLLLAFVCVIPFAFADTLGTTDEHTQSAFWYSDRVIANHVTATSDGTVDSISCYYDCAYTASCYIQPVLYEWGGSSFDLATSAPKVLKTPSSAEWHTGDIGGYEITSGTEYMIGCHNDETGSYGSMTIGRQGSGGDSTEHGSVSTLPDPLNDLGLSNDYSIYLTYTADAGEPVLSQTDYSYEGSLCPLCGYIQRIGTGFTGSVDSAQFYLGSGTTTQTVRWHFNSYSSSSYSVSDKVDECYTDTQTIAGSADPAFYNFSSDDFITISGDCSSFDSSRYYESYVMRPGGQYISALNGVEMYGSETEEFNDVLDSGDGVMTAIYMVINGTSTPSESSASSTEFYTYIPSYATSTSGYSTSSAFEVGATGYVSDDDWDDDMYVLVKGLQLTGMGLRGNSWKAGFFESDEMTFSSSSFDVSTTTDINGDGIEVLSTGVWSFAFYIYDDRSVLGLGFPDLILRSVVGVIVGDISDDELLRGSDIFLQKYGEDFHFGDDMIDTQDILGIDALVSTSTDSCSQMCYDEEGGFGIYKGICNIGCVLFYPSMTTRLWGDFSTRFKGRFPVNIFYSTATVLQNLDDSVDTPDSIEYSPVGFDGESIGDDVVIFDSDTYATSTILTTVRTLSSYALYFGFALLLFMRVKNII